jgi:putative glutamine amidotransferase
MKLIIGLSYAPNDNLKYDYYRNALRDAASVLEYEIDIVDFSNGAQVKEVDGILFTGGDDIAPARYGKETEEKFCGPIDLSRDSLEFHLAAEAEASGTPVLGICRGMQLLNVHRGGTLVTDIESFGGASHRKLDGYDSKHDVKIQPGSYLRRILSSGEGQVNSAHHQAVEQVGEGLTVSARADKDGTIEAIEWADPTDRPFFLAVQWHPERMDFSNPFACRIFETFLWECAANKMLKHRIGNFQSQHA